MPDQHVALEEPSGRDRGNTDFEKVLLRTHEEVAGLTREHDRLVRGVNPLIAEGNCGLAQSLPSVSQIVGEFLRQNGFSGCPTVVLLSVFDPLFAVMAFPTGHAQILMATVCELTPIWRTMPCNRSCTRAVVAYADAGAHFR
jgi:hypothetical protein